MYKLLLIVALLGSLPAFAQRISITAARQTAAGQTVTIKGVVTNGRELGSIRYMQDAAAGIGVYFSTAQLGANPVDRGDSLLVTGVLKQFNNLLELDPVTSYNVTDTAQPMPAPVEVTAAMASSVFAEAFEGRLVKIAGVAALTNSSGQPATTLLGNTNYRLDNVATQIARVVNTSTGTDGLVGKPAPSGAFDVTGIMSQFCVTPAGGACTTGYQLLPRLFEDFNAGAAPLITSRLEVVSQTQTTLRLRFTTNVAADTRVEYGPTPTLGSVFTIPAQVTAHEFDITGLTAGMLYYVKASATNGGGTAIAPVQVFATESNSTGRMTAYVTRPVNAAYAYPGNAAQTLTQTVDDTLIAYINRATESLDIAIYNFNDAALASISSALNAAKARGVRVRIVSDGGSANAGLNNLVNTIPRIASPTGTNPTGGFYGLMHNKFMVVDANATDASKPLVWTGSTNWTGDQINTDYNNVVIIQDQSLARSYTLEFEEMFGSTGDIPGTIYNGTTGTARFGANKTDNTAHTFKIGGKLVESHFSPSDQTTAQIIRTVQSAQSSFQTANLLITRTDIALAMRDQARIQTGATCSFALVNDSSNGGGVPFNIIQSALSSRIKVFNLAGLFHHKYLIVDQDQPTSDPTVLTGSHNWSNAGEQRNDENTLTIHDAAMANQFYQEFAARALSMSLSPCAVTSTDVAITGQAATLYPNPATESFTLTLPDVAPRTVRLLDSRGAEVARFKARSGQALPSPARAGIYLIVVDGLAKPLRLSVIR